MVTCAAPTRVIVIAGPARSGKTTLVASLYELFHAGPLSGFLFAGSRTLVGFERRCYLSRRASGRDTPETERTSHAAADVLLHLSVRGHDKVGRQDVLFTDIYGEAVRPAADSTDEVEQLTVLTRADHVAILVDGEKLASPAHRQEPYSQADALLASALEVGMLGPTSQVQLLVTKADALGDPNSAHRTFVKAKWTWLDARYRPRLATFEQFEVAARPAANSPLLPGHGLDNVFSLWASCPRPAEAGRRPNPPIDLGPFNRFGRAWDAKGG